MKTNYHIVDFILATGTNGDTIDTDRFPDGKILAASVCVPGGLPSQIVNLTISDSGRKLFQGSNLKDWQQRQGGDYISSMKPIGADGGKNYVLDFSSRKPLTSDVEGQVVFVIEQPQGTAC